MSSLRPAPGDLLLVRCVISEKVWQGAWLCAIITTEKPSNNHIVLIECVCVCSVYVCVCVSMCVFVCVFVCWCVGVLPRSK